MSLRTIILATVFTKRFAAIVLFFMPVTTHAGWTVDFSRRQSLTTGNSSESLSPDGNVKKAEEKNLLDRVFDTIVPAQDIVIINTEQGFLPSTVRIKEGAQYRIVVVNVNEKAKNVSFVLDSFSEHHATFYGRIKSFHIAPKKEGIYTFISPETSAQGRIVVYPAKGSDPISHVEMRSPASE